MRQNWLKSAKTTEFCTWLMVNTLVMKTHSTPRGYCLSPLIGLTICLAMVEWSHKLTYLTQSCVSKIDKLDITNSIWNNGPSIQSIKVGNIIELIAKCALLIFNIWATRCPVTQLRVGSLGQCAKFWMTQIVFI